MGSVTADRLKLSSRLWQILRFHVRDEVLRHFRAPAWHTHPAGQTLIVTEGMGWVQQEGGEKIEIKPGDVIWTPPGVKHWHGATAATSFTHIAITPVADGANVAWLEKVTDQQYAE